MRPAPGYLSALNFLFCFAISSESGFASLPPYHRDSATTTMADCAALLGAATFLDPPPQLHTHTPFFCSFGTTLTPLCSLAPGDGCDPCV